MSKRLTAFTLVLLLIVTAAFSAFAEEFTPQEDVGTYVDAFVTPAAVLAGDVFEVGIEVSNAEDLYGYSIEIKFDELIIDIVDEEGNQLSSATEDQPFYSDNPLAGVELINEIDPDKQTDEYLTYVATKTGNVPGSDFVGEDGYAELAYLYFKVDSSMTGDALPYDYGFTITSDRSVYDAGQANVLVQLSDSNSDPIAFETDPSSSVAYMYDPDAPVGEITLDWSGTPGYDLDAFFRINETEYGWYNAGKLEAPPHVVFLEDDNDKEGDFTAQEKFYYTQLTSDSVFHVDLFDVDDLSQNTGSITVTIDDYQNDNLDQTFSIANATGDGTDVWEVFRIDQSGNIVLVNELTDKESGATLDAPTITALLNQTDTVWNDGQLLQSELTRNLAMEIELPATVQTGYYDEQNQHFVGDVVVLDINDSLQNDLFNTHEALTVDIVSNQVATVEMLLDELNGIFANGETYQIKAWLEHYDTSGQMTGYSNDSPVVEFVYFDGGGDLPPGANFTDGDTDHVYFEGDSLAFTISDGFLPPTNDPDFSSNFSIVLFNNDQDVAQYSETAFTSGSFTHNADGTVSYSGSISGSANITTPGAIGVCFTPPEQAAPPIAWPLVFSDEDNTDDFALAGIEIPNGDVTASPALSTINDLYDTEQEISFTIGNLGSVSFGTGLDIIHDRDDLMNLPTAVTMGSLQDGNRYVEVDPASVAFLAGESATVTMNGITFSAVDIYEETSQSGDLVDNISLVDGTLVFDVAHFSRYIVSEDTGELSSDATVSSTEYTVDNAAGTISGVPFGTDLATFTNYLVPANGASYQVYQADGTTVATDLATDYKVTVTAEDETTTKTYTVAVEDAAGMTMSLEDKSGLNGATVSIPITAENGELMAGFQFDVGFDNTILTLDSFTLDDAFSGYMGSANIDNQNGTVRILYTSNPIGAFDTANYEIGTLEFTIIGTTGQTSNLTLSGVNISDSDIEAIECQIEGGSITVIDVIYGDLNDDQYVNIFDVMLCINHAVGSTLLDGRHIIAADVTGDGSVNIFDVMQIINKAVGNIDTFPVEQ